jgi:hypothetical protein
MAAAQRAFDMYLEYVVEEERRVMSLVDKHKSDPDGAAAKFANQTLGTIRSELERVKIFGISVGLELPKTDEQRREEEARSRAAILSMMTPTPPQDSWIQTCDDPADAAPAKSPLASGSDDILAQIPNDMAPEGQTPPLGGHEVLTQETMPPPMITPDNKSPVVTKLDFDPLFSNSDALQFSVSGGPNIPRRNLGPGERNLFIWNDRRTYFNELLCMLTLVRCQNMFMFQEFEKAQRYATEALKLAEKLEFKPFVGKVMFYQGMCMLCNCNFRVAYNTLRRADYLLNLIPGCYVEEDKARMYSNMALDYLRMEREERKKGTLSSFGTEEIS